MKYQLIKNYKNHPIWRQSFNRLAKQTFDIDFEKWYARGEWDNSYCCYSLLDQDEVIANVSATRMDVVVDGKPFKAVQIGTVMTHEHYRNQGLSKFLMEHVIELYKKEVDLIYLFANGSVFYYYQQFGLTPVKEYSFSPVLMSDLIYPESFMVSSDIRQMDLSTESDLAILKEIVHNRAPVSHQFGVLGGESIMSWYGINIYPKAFYYSQKLKTIIVCEINETRLDVYDIIAEKDLLNSQILTYIKGYFDELAKKGIIQSAHILDVRFHFTPDLCHIKSQIEGEKTEDLMFYLSEYVQLPEYFLYPIINHT